jgi:hypothetical protein
MTCTTILRTAFEVAHGTLTALLWQRYKHFPRMEKAFTPFEVPAYSCTMM